MRVNKRQASGLASPRPTTHRVVAGSSSSARRAVMTSGRARLRGECRQHSCGPGGAQRDLARRHPTSASPELTGAIRAASANAPLSHPFSVFGGRGRTVWGCGDGPAIFKRDWKLSSPHGSRQRGSKPGPPRRRRLCNSVDRLRVFLKPPSSATAAKHDHAKMAIALSERESVHSDRTARRRSTSRSNIRSGNITGLSPPSLLRTPARKRHLAAVGATRLPRSIRSELQRESDRRNPILFSG